MARGDGDHAVGLDEVVAAFAVLFAAQGIDETERRAEDAGADGETGAVGLPVAGFGKCFCFLVRFVANMGDFLFVLEHSYFHREGAKFLQWRVAEGTLLGRGGQSHKFGAVVGKVVAGSDGSLVDGFGGLEVGKVLEWRGFVGASLGCGEFLERVGGGISTEGAQEMQKSAVGFRLRMCGEKV